MIVADTNLISYLVLPGEHTREAEAVLRADPAWAAPLLWRSELRNVLATYVRGGRLALGDALSMAERAEELMAGREFTVPTEDVLSLAASSGCSAYDCEFVVLARELGVALVTVDAGLLSAFGDTAVAPEGCAGSGELGAPVARRPREAPALQSGTDAWTRRAFSMMRSQRG
ncbi:MAG: type II toxin-antitoxin system VapC family toxin, partial [Gemmatimonadetes bacterium]|nr:type II toxin-antitoxin system VapC family toxin [Gemmatimonadota bacterium]